jgi:hypothetical protein
MRSLGVCVSTPVSIHGEQFTVDRYALDLQGLNVVMGVAWLKTLVPITWDFDALTMAF